MEYPVVEITPTIQGEGYWTGMPVVLVRLAGCNMKQVCDAEFGCDTDFSNFTRMDVNEIVDRVREHELKTVLLTGGEPTIHDLLELVSAFDRARLRVHLETNGTRPLGDALNHIRWITVSPKQQVLEIEVLSELKMLVRPDLTIFPCEPEELVCRHVSCRRALKRILECPHECLSLQPMWGKTDERAVAELCIQRDYRLSIQTHKHLGLK